MDGSPTIREAGSNPAHLYILNIGENKMNDKNATIKLIRTKNGSICFGGHVFYLPPDKYLTSYYFGLDLHFFVWFFTISVWFDRGSNGKRN